MNAEGSLNDSTKEFSLSEGSKVILLEGAGIEGAIHRLDVLKV